ncbi:DNA-binding IscR family transcriptional regulator [Streptosporangium saharense]|uniref:DNA-binding IscR family transcriptional regulator n=2 Tax=Streptosporangium saharense TaxID=1706840 RepID=A0A7W7QV53_9ACTN|nr:DNA-binding IscR family transcriptional regulator [Streptosporangium saharense]
MGQSGGYLLTRPAGEISALEVVRAVDGDEPAARSPSLTWPPASTPTATAPP